MAEKNGGGGSRSGSSLADEIDNKLMKDLLSQVNQYKEKLKKGTEEWQKNGHKDAQAESDLTQLAVKDKQGLKDHIAELVKVMEKHRERRTADVEALEKEDEGLEEEILKTIFVLMDCFIEYVKWYKGAKLARMEKIKQEIEGGENSVNGMITRLDDLAKQVNELKSRKKRKIEQ